MFSPPVDPRYPATSYFTEKHRRHDWSIDPDNGIWIPVKGLGGFGEHRGVDFSCPVGTVVHAMSDGIVIRSRYESSVDAHVGAGLYVLQLVSLPGFDSWVLKYAHLKSVCVIPGQRIQKYETIGESGETGDVASPYLHTDLMDLRRQWKPIPIQND